jgi:hypothetical protein
MAASAPSFGAETKIDCVDNQTYMQDHSNMDMKDHFEYEATDYFGDPNQGSFEENSNN